MDYERIYNELCKSRKKRGIKKERGYEVHHIVPRCMGGSDEDHNLVKLTLREHFIAHRLLPKFVKGIAKGKLLVTVRLMTKDGRIRNSKGYEVKEFINKRALSLYNFYKDSDINPVMIGFNFSPRKEMKGVPLRLAKEMKIKTKRSKKTFHKLLAALRSHVLPFSDYFGLCTSRCQHTEKLSELLKKLTKRGLLIKVPSPSRTPSCYEITPTFKQLILEDVSLEIGVKYFSSPNTEDKDLISCVKYSSKNVFLLKAQQPNNYILYPRILSDIVKMDEDFVMEFIARKLTREQVFSCLKED